MLEKVKKKEIILFSEADSIAPRIAVVDVNMHAAALGDFLIYSRSTGHSKKD